MLTFFVSMDGSYMSFEVFPSVETLATTLNLTYIHSLILGIYWRISSLLCRYMAAPAFLR